MRTVRRIAAAALTLVLALSLFAACGESETKPTEPETVATASAEETDGVRKVEAVYLGVYHYGAEETNRENRDRFTYRFEIDGEETVLPVMNGTPDADGNFDYPIQNALKEGYPYRVTVENGVVTEVSEIAEAAAIGFEPRVSGTPGEATLKNFLSTALAPVGTTLYIYGGGWDWQDEGSAVQARTLGVSADWRRFFAEQDENYTYKEPDGDASKADPATSFYPYGEYNEYYYAGLDCSGYLGWVIYNTFETESGGEGYVGGSTKFAKRLADKGWGEWTQEFSSSALLPGDIVSIKGHVWISLGACADGSVLIAHSTPSLSRTGQPGGGVQISAIGAEKTCEAYVLAEKIMTEEYPEWSARYPARLCDPAVYLTIEGDSAGRFSWTTDGSGALTDPDRLREMTPAEVLDLLYGEGSL